MEYEKSINLYYPLVNDLSDPQLQHVASSMQRSINDWLLRSASNKTGDPIFKNIFEFRFSQLSLPKFKIEIMLTSFN
jgi:hypothetical protein